MREMLLAQAEEWHVPRLPVGDQIANFRDWLLENFSEFFDTLGNGIIAVVRGFADALAWPPVWVMGLVFALLALWLRGWKFALVSLAGFALIDAFGAFESAMQTLSLVLFAGVIAVAIAIPLGILAARSSVVSGIVKPVMDFLQTLPPFVYLIPVVGLFSIGEASGLIATVVFALPPGVRLTELGIRQVDKEMVEAGEAFGSPPRRILTGIQIPLAMPSIMAGVNQIIMLALSMVVIAGMVGAPGLGADVFQAISTLDVGFGFERGVAVVVLAIYLDRMTGALSTRSAVSKARRLAGTA